MTPYNLEKITQQSSNDGTYHSTFEFHDFNKDGISEQITANNSKEISHYSLAVTDNKGNYIDQLNYSEPVEFSMSQNWTLFDDYNGDNLDDVFTLTQAGDSLFLYVHDLYLKKVIINRLFLLKAEASYPKVNSRMRINGMKLIDVKGKKNKCFLFSIDANSSIRPRGVYIFDIDKAKIIKRFETDAFIANVNTYNLTGDGNDEIIITTNATGNVHYKTKYTDQKSWLFVLDNNLNNIFEPMSFGQYRTGLTCNPIEIQSQRFLLLTQRYSGTEDISDAVFLINSKGKILPQKKLKFSPRLQIYKPLTVDQTGNNFKLFTWQGNKSIISLDKNFNITNKITTDYEEIAPYKLLDLNNDGQNEIICLAKNDLVILNNNLKLLASIYKPINTKTNISFREDGKNKPVDIAINDGNYLRIYSFNKSIVYSMLPVFAIGLSLCIFIVLIALFEMLYRIFTFSRYHRFSLVNAEESVIMLDDFGVIRNYNENAKKLFDLEGNSKRKKYFESKLNEVPELLELINKSMKNGKRFNRWLSISTRNGTIEANVSIAPILSKFKYFRSYLIELQAGNNSVISGKLAIWSKAAQRMVHDIKYPLSVAAVKLDTLKTRIESLDIKSGDTINNDFEVIKGEIKRVNSIAKSFLKFSELEKPNFQVTSIKEIIKNCIKRYEGYVNNKLKIEVSVDEDVDSVWADEQQIELVLHNLVENSLDAVNGNGYIKISATLAQYLDNSLEDKVEIEVADTGPGIDEKIREHIFQPYTTTKPDGTGIGLAIAKKIIEDHGSDIDFYTKPGFGTVVRFAVKVPK